MTTPNDNQGAINALKGLRVQFLYSLHRILSATEVESYFRPEGTYEDLEILSLKKEIIEAIQVKNLKRTLTFSDIFNHEKNCLINRGLKAHQDGNNPIINLVSFSDVNNDIKELSCGNYSPKFISELKKKGLKDKQIEILKQYFKYEVLNEKKVTENVSQKLIDSNYFADILITFDLLIYWIYIAAEKQQVIERDSLRKQFIEIGSFQTERTNFSKHFGHLILTLKNDQGTENPDILRNEFFQGISAKYQHILAELDVPRNDKLKIIENEFKKKNVVFIHGASGQGKSTLAYRFLNDYCDENTVFELKLPPDYSTVYEVIIALEGISEGLGFPMTLYVDVSPGNKEWVNLITELSTKKNFRFLVSIREEDWRSVAPGDKFLFAEIELKLNVEEAELIYDGLDEFSKDKRYTDFNEAWQHFGGDGPLLEFVYLITQTQSLESKIKSQISRLLDNSNSKDKVELLKYVSLADSFGARIKYKDFFQKQKIPNSKLIIHQLKEEYLIQTTDDEIYILGLHPVRSNIIRRILFDLIMEEEAEYAIESISFISDNTLLDFLRNSFTHAGLNIQKLLIHLIEFKPSSWQAYCQILKSLLWKGISDYLETNLDLLNQIHQKYGIGWITVVSFDFTNIWKSGNMVEDSDIFSEEHKNYAREMNNKFSAKEDVFKYCQKWIDQISFIEVCPRNKFDWDAFGLFLFWLHHFQISSIQIDFSKFDFEKLFKEYPITGLGQIIYSLKLYNPETLEIEKKFDLTFLTRLHNEFKIFYLEEKENKFECKYIVDIQAENYEPEEKDILHARSIKIIELLRLVYPLCESYAVRGYGHKFSFLPNDYDSSEKDIVRERLPLKPLTELSSIYINKFSNYQRPKDWQEYVNKIMEQRAFFSSILTELCLAFNQYHVKQDWRNLNNYLLNYSEKHQLLIVKSSIIPYPSLVIDEWGDFGDSEKNNKDDKTDIRPAISVHRYKQFKEEYSEYHRTITNFLRQSAEVINEKLLQFLGKEFNDYSNIARVSLVANLFELYKHIQPFQKQFRFHFEKFIDVINLKQLENKEKEAIISSCYLWRQYLYDGKFITEKKNVSKLAIEKIIDTKLAFQNRLQTSFQKLAKEIGFKIRFEFEEEKERCLIFIEIDDASLVMNMIQLVYSKLRLDINSPDYTSIKYLQLSAHFQSFFLIPLIKGRTLSNLWNEFRLFNLLDKNFEDLEQHSLLPIEIDIEVLKKYEIKSWHEVSDEIQNLQKMVVAVSTAYQLGYHLMQFDGLETDDSEIGLEMAKLYISDNMNKFIEHLQTGINLLENTINKINDYILEISMRNDFNEVIEILKESLNLFFPTEDSAISKTFPGNFQLEILNQWVPRLEQLTINLGGINSLLTSVIIDKIEELIKQ